MFIKIISAILSFFLSAASFVGIPVSESKTEKVFLMDELNESITSSAEKRISEGKLTGAHIIVNQNQVEIFNKTYGLKEEGGEALSANATYRIASMTKPITAVALLKAYDLGLVDIYADVADYLPEFKDMYIAKRDADGNVIVDEDGNYVKGEKAQNQIKVYQTVSHVTGLQECIGNPANKKITTIDESIEYISSQPLNFEPGTNQSYCTSSYDIAAKIIELKSGLEFEVFLKKYIFTPLGMTDTTFEPSQDQWSRLVAIQMRDDNGKAYSTTTPEGCIFGSCPVTYHAAGAALMSTASDYMKFANMLLNNGKAADGTEIISEKSVKLMATPIPDMEKGFMGGSYQWGLGVRVIVSKNSTLPVGTFGWSGAYGTHFWVDTTNNITAVYMKNSGYDGGAGSQTGNEFEEDVMSSLVLKSVYDMFNK